ncbi:HNH endonuclease signature motif containing protein [Klebsiella quasipneumoniae]|uniref:HNH endonuclease signature motif containing protein n=1 Tax=Klebsiella quasipneumoniae TaxID=1463165 RepID=UPI0022044AF5|nr:HNH endonuclease signature motif containing protein [Klebsiella quasipneumoniae]BDO05971.1 hypothetical protein KAM622c_55580 [Klebsiella quasipneumoniae subsp. quasipneumoniae]
MKMTKPKPVSRMKRPFISELAELGLSGEILSIRTDGMQGTLIPDLTAGVSEAGRVKTGNWVISDKRTFDHVVLCVERQDENHDVFVGKFIQLHVAANKSLKIVEMGDVKLVAITSSIPTTFNGGIRRFKGVTFVSLSQTAQTTIDFPKRIYKEGQECTSVTSPDQGPFARDVRLNCYGRCVVTGVRSPWRTEAAHLTPRHEEGIPDVTNGILLRRDIHTLFDNDHCAINPDTMKIYFSREARELDDDLQKWHGDEIETTRMQVPVNIENLRIRWQKFKAKDRQRK